jgi:hypothetical protein
LDAFLDKGFGFVCAFPALHLHPFAFFEVFVALEEVLDLFEETCGEV